MAKCVEESMTKFCSPFQSEVDSSKRISELEAEAAALQLQVSTLLSLNEGLREAHDELKVANETLTESNAKVVTLNNNLVDQLRTLKPLTPQQPPLPPPVQSVPTATTSTEPCMAFSFPENIAPTSDSDKEYFDVLILSDSIYRHVGTSCPKDPAVKDPPPIYDNFNVGGLEVLKVVIPGARAARLAAEAATLAETRTFGEIVVNCGANYIPSAKRRGKKGRKFVNLPMEDVIKELNQLLLKLGQLFEGLITFSPILPQVNNFRYLHHINGINEQVAHFCSSQGFDWIFFDEAFEIEETGKVNKKLFARDGIHLSKDGIETLRNCFESHIKETFKHDLII